MKHDYRKLQYQLSQTNKQYQEAVSEKLQYQKQVGTCICVCEREREREWREDSRYGNISIDSDSFYLKFDRGDPATIINQNRSTPNPQLNNCRR